MTPEEKKALASAAGSCALEGKMSEEEILELYAQLVLRSISIGAGATPDSLIELLKKLSILLK